MKHSKKAKEKERKKIAIMYILTFSIVRFVKYCIQTLFQSLYKISLRVTQCSELNKLCLEASHVKLKEMTNS